MDSALVRGDGTAVHRIRHHGNIDHGPGEAGRIGRFGVEGQLEGGAVELSHLLARNYDPRLCYASGLCRDALW